MDGWGRGSELRTDGLGLEDAEVGVQSGRSVGGTF